MLIGYNTLSENPYLGSGSLDYFIEMSHLLTKLDSINQYSFIVSRRGKKNFADIPTSYGGYSNENKIKRIIAEHLLLPFLLKRQKIDVLFTTSSGGIAPYLLSKNTRLVLGVFATQHYKADLLDYKRKIYRNTLIKGSLQKAELIVVNSNLTKQDVLGTNFVDESRIRVIPHGIDGRVFNELAVTPAEQMYFDDFHIREPYFLFVSTIYSYKNLQTLVEAFGKFVRSNGESHCLVVIGSFEKGEDSDSYREVMSIISKYNISKLVKFLGKIDKQLLRVFYRKADIYIQPSLFETYGKTTLEAMACGCPVIGANISATPEVIGEAGLLFEPTDSDDLVEKLELILSNDQLKAQFLSKALVKADTLSLINEALSYISVFNELA